MTLRRKPGSVTRGVGEFEAIQGTIPEWLALVIALVTQLGDIWFVSLLLAALFVRFDGVDRDRIATVGGLAIGAVGLTFALKYLFALPRPNEPLIMLEALPALLQPVYAVTGYASGYGFPSGHAVVTTVVYLALAGTLSVGSRRRRYAGAMTVIVLVCCARVALGLHYLVDVLAGAALGVAFLFVAFRLLARYRSAEQRRTVALGVGVALAGVSVVASGIHHEPLVLFVAASVAFGLSYLLDGSRVTRA